MVTDEERDYMYRVYARTTRRRADQPGHPPAPRAAAEATTAADRADERLLFSLPGTPVLYYGDEIGMGDNIYLGDRDGVRTPMQWSAGPQRRLLARQPAALFLPVIIDPEYHYEASTSSRRRPTPRRCCGG
jgi:maltose alpha-D-glucosyltransferase/alpha-amylase